MKDRIEPISMIEVQLKSFVDSKRPKDEVVSKQLDFGYSWDGQNLEIGSSWIEAFRIRLIIQ